ncbi:uncharacterized protein LOC111253707 isoform X1 [Varroa destructor]|uniref:Uncharacterized protein n=2 Tax=Varroa destructor TaxID=109461 RepID=A0A7M7KMS1_VARDE|nr:uncharacterized protein LOC111253707 isoform X1 [Varroa destructor]
MNPDGKENAIAHIDEVDSALRMLRCMIDCGTVETTLCNPKLAPFMGIIRNHPELVALTKKNRVRLTLFDRTPNKVTQLRQTKNRKISQKQTSSLERPYINMVATLTKIKEMAALTWTFTYPVPREIFSSFLATFEVAKKLPAAIGLGSKYEQSICCLIEDFEVTPAWVRHKCPALRFLEPSSTGSLCPKDFFYDFIGLMDANGVDANLVLATSKTSNEGKLKAFDNLESIREYLVHYLPNEVAIVNGRMIAICPSDDTSYENDISNSHSVSETTKPTSSVNDSVQEKKQSWRWEPSSPLELLNFFGLRMWAFETWPESREFGVATNPGIPLDELVKQMHNVLEKSNNWQIEGRRILENYEGFHLQEGRLFAVSPESILYPSNKLHLLVYIEDICKKLRSMVNLPTKVYRSLYEVEDCSLDSPLRYLSKTLSTCRSPEPVKLNAARVPLSDLNKLILALPQTDQQKLAGIFPGDTLLRHLPLLSVLTAYPILTTADEWLLT